MPQRLDVELVARGLARSRAQAQAMISCGGVRVDGVVARKAAIRVAATSLLEDRQHCLAFDGCHMMRLTV